MEAIFSLAGHIVSYSNGVIAILFIALSPLYIFFFICYKNKVAIRSVLPIFFLSLASALSTCLVVIFAITSIALGAWG